MTSPSRWASPRHFEAEHVLGGMDDAFRAGRIVDWIADLVPELER